MKFAYTPPQSFFFQLLFFVTVHYQYVQCVRNLFIPRTGDNIASSNNNVSPAAITENLSNVTNFQSLLGAGRSLSYPFAAGMLLSIATIANENNWKVSDEGFSKILGIPRDEIVESYGALFDTLETDENVTLSNMLFSFNPKFSPSEALLETLMTEVREVTWTRDTWKETYKMMVEHLSNVTNEKIDKALIPPVTKIGTPFRKSTQAVILSTFHYINGWQYPWRHAELGSFQGNPGIPYMMVEGNFLVAEEDEYTAVSVPLEGGTKSVVFVLPHANITSKYFRNQAEGARGENEETVDIVPFPKKWMMRQLRFKVPAFNTTDVDQYGEELEQTGMNETFCTIIRDPYGRFPYYLRPMVQINSLDFNEDFFEIASASGVAVEKYQTLFSIIINGSGGDNDDDDKKQSSLQSKPQQPKPTDNERLTPEQQSWFSENVHKKSSPVESKSSSNERQATATYYPEQDLITVTTETAAVEFPTLTMDRSFLWYLNDTDVGPMFFGTVEILVNLAFAENSTSETERPPDSGDETMGTTNEPPVTTTPSPSMPSNSSSNGNNEVLSDIEKYYLWSCRSYNVQGEKGEGKTKMPSPDNFIFQFEDSDSENILSNSEASVKPSSIS